MNEILRALHRHARTQPGAIALKGAQVTLDYAEAGKAVNRLADTFSQSGTKSLGLLLEENSPPWAVADLAAMQAGIPVVPLPGVFSDSQLRHAIRNAGIDGILTDQPERLLALLGKNPNTPIGLPGKTGHLFRLPVCGETRLLPPGVSKLTYTSGTTGQPKGVMLGETALERVTLSLAEASQAGPRDRHVSVLPLSTLLENIGGVYVPLLSGAQSILLPLSQVGLIGSSGINPALLAQALHSQGATSTIFVPQLLSALLFALRAGAPLPSSFRFAAVGGAPVSKGLLLEAAAVGLPVFQGYGLSECASVVALNTPDSNRPGSAGKPLPHVRIRIADDGEILVGGTLYQGYLGDAPPGADAFHPTGDLGHLDDDGHLHLIGRKKHIFINAFGRNVSPDWVESELTRHPAIAQAAVFGEGRPWNTAVIVPRALPGADPHGAVSQAIALANAELPDYARIGPWIPAAEPFSPANGLLTPNGRLRRSAILAAYQETIEQLYQRREAHDVL